MTKINSRMMGLALFLTVGALVGALMASVAFADAAAGKQVYDQSCVACHGAGGSGGFAPSLKKSLTADAIKNKVRQGGGGMPAFSATQVSDAQLTDLVAYVQSLAPAAATPAPTTAAATATTAATPAASPAAATPTAAAAAQLPRTGDSAIPSVAILGGAIGLLLLGAGTILKMRGAFGAR